MGGSCFVPDKERGFIACDIFSKICSDFESAAEISVPSPPCSNVVVM